MYGQNSQQKEDGGTKCQLCPGSAEQGNSYFPCPRSCFKIWSRETGSTVPSRVNLLHTQAESVGRKLAYNNAIIRAFPSSNIDVTYKRVCLCIIPTAEGRRRALVREYLDHIHLNGMMYIYTYVQFYMPSFTLLPETMERFSFG